MRKSNIVLLVGVLVIVPILLLTLNTLRVSSDILKYKLEMLKDHNDSLRNELSQLEQFADEKELTLRSQMEGMEMEYKAKLANLDKKYSTERDRIKTLPITEQVELLSDNIWQTDLEPALTLMDGDTSIILKPIHVISINETYNDFEGINESFELCKGTVDSLFNQVDSALGVIDAKNIVIAQQRMIDRNNQQMIDGLNQAIKADNKLSNRRLLKTGVGAVVVGFVVGVLVFN